MKTSATGVTRTLRDAGLRVGIDLKVKARDPESVRVSCCATTTQAREKYVMRVAEVVLGARGYTVLPGLQPWYLIVTKEN